MSRLYNIRWKQDDNEELRKAVKNFNAKISRLEKKNPEQKNALPSRISVKQIKELITTRQDLNRELNALKRFSKRGAEDLIKLPNNNNNLQITRWQKNEMTRRIGVINRRRKKRLEDIGSIDVFDKGKPTGYKAGQVGMGRIDRVALTPLTLFYPTMDQRSLDKRYKQILKESQDNYWMSQDIILKQNYIKSLHDNFNQSDIEGIIETIEKMDYKDFYEKFQSIGGNFELNYPMMEEQYDPFLNELYSIWAPDKEPPRKIMYGGRYVQVKKPVQVNNEFLNKLKIDWNDKK